VSGRSARCTWAAPLWWCLFGAGALSSAVLLPPLCALFSLRGVSESALAFGRVQGLVYGPLGLLFVLAAVVLPVFQAMYRLRHILHDLQLGHGQLFKRLCYAAALLIGALALGLWGWGSVTFMGAVE
jgi:fumarate reductase subunit D